MIVKSSWRQAKVALYFAKRAGVIVFWHKGYLSAPNDTNLLPRFVTLALSLSFILRFTT
jgi:hypothetical protein